MNLPSDPAVDLPRRLDRPEGVVVAYRVRRPPTADHADAVLLVHGLASNLTRFAEFVGHTTLAARQVLIRVDLRGHGGSITRRRVGMDLWSDDLAAVLQAEGCSTAVVVGHSLGAQVAAHFAARHRAMVRGVVLIDPVYRDALHGQWLRLAQAGPLIRAAARLVRGVNALGVHRGALPPLDLRALDEVARRALVSPEAERAFVERYSSARADLRHVPLAVYLQDLVEMFRPAPTPRELDVPVLALLSTGATFADGATMRKALAGPAVSLQTIDCHHWPLTERPVEVRQAIERWCEALP